MSPTPALARRARRTSDRVSPDRVALALIVVLAGFLELFALDREGFSNLYYAAAVRSMLAGPSTFFFGAFDPGGFITLDKPPLGFWLEVLSARIFGYSGVALLLPGALAAVASVWLLARLVAHQFGRLAGLIAALVLAVTPISVATARNNTVDSVLVLFVLLAVAALLRWGDTGRLRWLVLAGILVGVGFNVKMLEAYLVLPGIVLAVLIDRRWSIARRIGHLAASTVALLVVSFAWAIAVDAIPAASRPFIGGSAVNSAIDLALNYNGIERLAGGQTFPNLGRVGPLRLFDPSLSGQIGWWLILGLLGILVAVTELRRRPARRRFLVPLALWAGWFLPAAAFFSVARFWHPHYLVMLAPPIAALTGAGSVALLRAWRRAGSSGWLLPLAVAASGVLEATIIGLARGFDWLQGAAVVLSLALAGGLLLVRAGVGTIERDRFAGRGLLIAAVLGLAIAPLSWSAWTTFHAPGDILPVGGPPLAGAAAQGGFLGLPAGGPGGAPGSGVGPGSSSPLIAFVLAHQHDATFALATASAQEAAPIIIATGLPVMALGGYSGDDQTLTVEQFQARVAAGNVRYVLTGGFGGGGGYFGGANLVIRWARSACVPVRGTLTGQIVDCQPASSSSSTGPKASIDASVIGSRTSWTAPMPARA
ncbi:MAG TPA: glycosyltransferase family 39 protein [Candidatus Limnocylindrales bacterium]|nr:glycosyltransferase family 39 protein [Candidatus Limnocylindrales bacterium]